jgi:hypothetical protein
MTEDKFISLTPAQRQALILGMAVRNALEPFHASDHYGLISDAVMPELNQRVRDALHMASYAYQHVDRPGCAEYISNYVRMIPDYWEVPAFGPGEQEYLDKGFSPEQYEKYEEARRKRDADDDAKWEAQALSDRERLLAEWFKRLLTSRTTRKEGGVDLRVGPDEIMAQMESLGFPQRGLDALAAWANVYCRAGLRRWCEELVQLTAAENRQPPADEGRG